MADFINTIDALGDDVVMDSIIDRTITEFKDDKLTSLGNHAFRGCNALKNVSLPEVIMIDEWCEGQFSYCTSLESAEFPKNTAYITRVMFEGCTSLKSVSFPEATTVCLYGFRNCKALETISFPKVTDLRICAFEGCESLKDVSLPELVNGSASAFAYCAALEVITLPKLVSIPGSNMYSSMFRNCFGLKIIDVPSVTAIDSYGLYNCRNLTALLLRNTETICSLAASTSLSETAVSSGNLYIYVPRALLSDDDETMDYRRATNWSALSAQFRALEDYTVDGTVTGELDETKI